MVWFFQFTPFFLSFFWFFVSPSSHAFTSFYKQSPSIAGCMFVPYVVVGQWCLCGCHEVDPLVSACGRCSAGYSAPRGVHWPPHGGADGDAAQDCHGQHVSLCFVGFWFGRFYCSVGQFSNGCSRIVLSCIHVGGISPQLSHAFFFCCSTFFMESQNLQFCHELGYKRPPHCWEVGGWILTKPGGEHAVTSNPAS